jgi:hypothetical protein
VTRIFFLTILGKKKKARDGIEPPTQAFSVTRSADYATGPTGPRFSYWPTRKEFSIGSILRSAGNHEGTNLDQILTKPLGKGRKEEDSPGPQRTAFSPRNQVFLDKSRGRQKN